MIRSIFHWLHDFILPPRCPFCGTLTPTRGAYCNDCQENRPECLTYTLSPNSNRKDLYCVRSPYYYSGVARKAIHALKFHQHQSAATELAYAMAAIPQMSGLKDADFVTAVPISKKRLAVRGYNQSQLIAEHYAMIKGLPYVNTMGRRNGRKQSLQYTARERAANVKGVFYLLDGVEVNGKTIILIDDVYTTGATLRECARTLRRAGAKCVLGLTGCTAKTKKADLN